MRRSLRQAVRQRYNYRCGYCMVGEVNVGAELTVDHFMPRIQGGDDSEDNLVYCCHACNEFKGDYWNLIPELRLLHPLNDQFSSHCKEAQEDGLLLGITNRGINHLLVLHLNRPELIAFRLEQREIRRLRQLNEQLLRLLERSQRVTAEIEVELERETGESG